MEENSFSDKIKNIFFDHKERFSRETFAITLTALLLFTAFTSPFIYKLCSLFLPFILVLFLVLAYVAGNIYAMFVLYIKRLHDLNRAGWLSVLILFPFLNIYFTAWLCLKKGTIGPNDYGGSLNYEGPRFLLYLCYGVLCFYGLAMVAGLFYWKKLGHIENTGSGVQQMISVLPKEVREELKNNPKAMGALFIENKFTTAAVSITENRVLVRGVDFKRIIEAALSENKPVEVRFSDNSMANITKLITANDSLSVQMAVFEIDKPIGVPAKLREENRKLLEEMKAY